MTIHDNLSHLIERIHLAEDKHHRQRDSVTLLAVSKKQSAEKIRDAFHAGQKYFGENYVQEALKKQALLTDLTIEWHFIGTIQSNKIKMIAAHFDWVHSVNTVSAAEQLNAHRSPQLPPLNICIEVNIDSEKTKSGVAPDDVLSIAKKIMTLNNLNLRGLMIIPNTHNAKAAFQQTHELQNQLIQSGILLDTLSMGMSADFELAIAAGSTLVRIGTAIFGERVL